MKEEKLRDVINEELRRVTALITSDISQDVTDIKRKWLLSLQHIDDVCKNRNRY